jgi:hypothetical protein
MTGDFGLSMVVRSRCLERFSFIQVIFSENMANHQSKYQKMIGLRPYFMFILALMPVALVTQCSW